MSTTTASKLATGEWVKRLNDQRDQAVARRELSDRFEACAGHPVRDGQHHWRRKWGRWRTDPWHEQCTYCGAMRDVIE